MNIVLFSHPSFMQSRSMPRYTENLERGLTSRGHTVEVWRPKAKLYGITNLRGLNKWMGYIDQYILFPITIKRKISKISRNTLFVLTDQALGPWLRFLRKRPHVVHCHDFLTLKSARGFFPENRLSLFGRLYQFYIENGFRQGKYFISVSKKTRVDLHHFLKTSPLISEVIYNCLIGPDQIIQFYPREKK